MTPSPAVIKVIAWLLLPAYLLSYLLLGALCKLSPKHPTRASAGVYLVVVAPVYVLWRCLSYAVLPCFMSRAGCPP